MAVEDVLYSYLITQSGITDIVATGSIDHVDNLESAVYPRITYVKIDSPELYQATDQWQRWRFFVNSRDRAELNTIMDELTSSLNRAFGDFSGMYINFIQKLNEGQIILRDDSIYESYIDFRILYN
jgi:hypothetical protein